MTISYNSEQLILNQINSELDKLELDKFNAEILLRDELKKAESEYQLLKKSIKELHKKNIDLINKEIHKNKYLIKVLNNEINIPDSELIKVKEKWDDKLMKAFNKLGKPIENIKPKEIKNILIELYPYFEFTQTTFNNAWALFKKNLNTYNRNL